MADNVAITPGAGATVASDDVGGVQYQVVKLDQGGNGVASPVTTAAPLGVAPIAGQVGVQGGAGATNALTQRVVHATDDALMGILTETAPATDTASSGINGRLQRIAQRLSTIITALGAGAGGGLKVDGSGTALPVTVASGSVTVSSGTTTATLTNVSPAGASAQLLASNSSRKGWYVYNDSAVVMYVKYGTTASATSFTQALAAATGWGDAGIGLYQGRIDVLSASGTARVTEW